MLEYELYFIISYFNWSIHSVLQEEFSFVQLVRFLDEVKKNRIWKFQHKIFVLIHLLGKMQLGNSACGKDHIGGGNG